MRRSRLAWALLIFARVVATSAPARGQEGAMPPVPPASTPPSASSPAEEPLPPLPAEMAGAPSPDPTPESSQNPADDGTAEILTPSAIRPAAVPPRPRPGVLNRSLGTVTAGELPAPLFETPPFLRTEPYPTPGYAGRSHVQPIEDQSSSHFVPVPDRWRIGYPAWDRYGTGHPIGDESPYSIGRILDPYNQNVLKGDYPIYGQHTFLDISALSILDFEGREIPTQTSGFESTSRPFEGNSFGRANSFFTLDFFSVVFDVFHGDAAFKPVDWRIKLAPTLGISNFSFSEQAQVNPNVLEGTTRTREFWALQEAFVEYKIADIGPDYDFVSVRAGNQPFNADFRGFLFLDINRAVRFFGTRNNNRDQWNIAYFRQWEKDTNTGLNTFNDRGQNLIFANYYRQDFLFPGYTALVSVNYDNDLATIKFDKNRFLVRPDAVGNFQPHEVDAVYFGWGGDGHWGRYNLTHQFYEVVGHDTMNPLANRAQTINAQMFAIEGSYDRDWARFRVSFFYASGDGNINNSHATGFDTILDGPNFAGGPFSFWNRQVIPLQNVNLTQRLSLVPDLRSSKIQGQANFVNPGLILPTLGADFELTPKFKLFTNGNMIWFDKTSVLQQFLYQGNIDRFIGVDLSLGGIYRPLVHENLSFIGGVSMLIPGQGFLDIYNNFNSRSGSLVAGFLTAVAAF